MECKVLLTKENAYSLKTGRDKGNFVGMCKKCSSILRYRSIWKKKEEQEVRSKIHNLLRQTKTLINILEEVKEKHIMTIAQPKLEEEYKVSVVEDKSTYLVCKACGDKKSVTPSSIKKRGNKAWYCDYCRKFNIDVIVLRKPKLPEHIKIYELYIENGKDLKKLAEITDISYHTLRSSIYQVEKLFNLNITFDELKKKVFSSYNGNPK